MECVEELSGERGEFACECADMELLARFEIRCAAFVGFALLELLFFIVWTLMASSIGGLGRLRSIILLLTPQSWNDE